jgi:hypothetical protein
MGKKVFYQGYLWWNDKPSPNAINKKMVDVFNPEALKRKNGTYVVEGLLWIEEKQVSYTIRHIDGHHVIIKTELEKKKSDLRCESSYYYSGKLSKDGVEQIDVKLHFVQFWEEEVDPLCENMKVLRPGKLVFVGFENK